MPQDEWEEDEEQSVTTVTPEDKAALDSIKASGFTPQELLSRARSHYEAETAAASADAGPDAKEDGDDGAVMTQADGKKYAKQAALEARLAVIESNRLTAMEGEVEKVLKASDLRNLDDEDLEEINRRVARRLGEHAKIRTMPIAELRTVTEQATKAVVDKWHGRGTADTDESDEDLATRLEGKKAAGGSGGSGAPGRSSSRPPAGSGAVDLDGDEAADLPFGLEGDWPSSQEITAKHEKELKEFLARERVKH
jgi:hypothetical protein